MDSPNVEDVELIAISDSDESGEQVYEFASQGLNKSIKAIFSVVFDLKSGPKIEFQVPSDLDLAGVEFYALASGLHSYDKVDIIYFRLRDFYGIGAYKRHLKDGKMTRGAVMRTLGVLADHYSFLNQFKDFLERYVLKLNLENLTEKQESDLNQYYLDNGPTSALATTPVPTSSIFFNLPSGVMTLFLSSMGPLIFPLWRAVLLGKRILFCGPPPLRRLSYLVYASSLLSKNAVKLKNWEKLNVSNPLFYVNISTDTDILQREKSFMACTTEEIFEGKWYYYDVFVKIMNQQIDKKMIEKAFLSCIDADAPFLEVTETDFEKYERIKKEFIVGQENELLSRFIEANNKILYYLSLADIQNNVVTPNDMKDIGLVEADFPFVVALAKKYQLNSIIFEYPYCCTRCLNFCC